MKRLFSIERSGEVKPKPPAGGHCFGTPARPMSCSKILGLHRRQKENVPASGKIRWSHCLSQCLQENSIGELTLVCPCLSGFKNYGTISTPSERIFCTRVFFDSINPRPPAVYKRQLAGLPGPSHVTIEVGELPRRALSAYA